MSITDIGYIQEVARLLRENGLTKVDVADGDMKISVARGEAAAAPAVHEAAPVGPEKARTAPAPEKDVIDFNSVYEVKSPMVGVFYTAPSPEDEPFVRIGDEVKEGDVLCILEAMKLMNEIAAERGGKIVDICLKNGDVVEFGQVLFKLS
jgi:acetyl-CoA carboxylase biotin carboxyl carrier protein